MSVFIIQLCIGFFACSNHIFFFSLISLFMLQYLYFLNVYPNLPMESYFYFFQEDKVLVFLKISSHFFYLPIPELSSMNNLKVDRLYICLEICYMNTYKDGHNYNTHHSRLKGERMGIQPNYNNQLGMDRLHFLHKLEVSTYLKARLISNLDPYNMQYDFHFRFFNLLIPQQSLL